MSTTVDYATGSIADREYPVTAARTYGREDVVGQPNAWGNLVVGITFYTGFAGCPARYYITTEREGGRGTQTTVGNATGLYTNPTQEAIYAAHRAARLEAGK